MMEMKGKKQDEGKLNFALLPLEELEDLVRVMEYGAKKYGEKPREQNWKNVNNGVDRYSAALLRHFVAWRKGEVLDSESKLPHLAHVIFNAMCLNYHAKKEQKQDEIAESWCNCYLEN